jgi:hypothetical protein
MVEKFSAGAQALGYYYQSQYALYLILSEREETELVIEGLDDVVFEEKGTPRELLQFKHHSNSKASLSDSSPDFWKTIRVWSTNLTEKNFPLDFLLTFITTSQALDGSVAALLRPDKKRNPEVARQRLVDIATKSENNELKKCFDAFLYLSVPKQEQLVNAIQILDASPHISEISQYIKDKINLVVRKEFLDPLYERLEGWWFNKVFTHLSGQSLETITRYEVHDKISEVSEQLRSDSLPVDFIDATPSETPNPDTDNRHFVLQLKLIALQNKRIEKAILDYYRAFEQRSRWIREELLAGGELEKYERKLIDEWERHYWACQEGIDTNKCSEKYLQDCGKDIYNWAEFQADIRIRPRVNEPYIVRGSYHILADQKPPKVGWHPKFKEMIESLLKQSKNG